MGKWAPHIPWLIISALLFGSFWGDKLLGNEAFELEPPAQRTYGAVFDVPGFDWVTLLNPDGVQTSDLTLGFWDSCLIRYRGEVQEITSHWSWYAWWSDEALVEYRNPQGAPATGVLCPDGTVFLVPREALGAYQQRYEARRAYEDALRSEVTTAMAEPPGGTPRPVEDIFRWVEVANPQGVETYGYDVPFLDVCGIQGGGTVQALHDTSRGTLFAYRPHPRDRWRGVGIPCPDNTVFFWNDSTAVSF